MKQDPTCLHQDKGKSIVSITLPVFHVKSIIFEICLCVCCLYFLPAVFVLVLPMACQVEHIFGDLAHLDDPETPTDCGQHNKKCHHSKSEDGIRLYIIQ